MTSDRDAFLAGILANPDADLPRLAYADWLDEQGNRDDSERAEFIRVQCDPQLAAWKANAVEECSWGGTCECYGHKLHRRERSLFLAHNREWFGDTALRIDREEDGDLPDIPRLIIRRGFVEVVRAPLAWLIGGECEECEGSGNRWGNGSALGGPCPTCHGTGRTTGHLREIVRTQPVTTVVVTDREPENWDHDWMNEVAWLDERSPIAGTHGHCSLPVAVFDLLEGGRINDTSGTASNRNVWRIYQTAESARSSLSDALIRKHKESPA